MICCTSKEKTEQLVLTPLQTILKTIKCWDFFWCGRVCSHRMNDFSVFPLTFTMEYSSQPFKIPKGKMDSDEIHKTVFCVSL